MVCAEMSNKYAKRYYTLERLYNRVHHSTVVDIGHKRTQYIVSKQKCVDHENDNKRSFSV